MKTGAIVIAEWLQEKMSRSVPLDDATSLMKHIDDAIKEAVTSVTAERDQLARQIAELDQLLDEKDAAMEAAVTDARY